MPLKNTFGKFTKNPLVKLSRLFFFAAQNLSFLIKRIYYYV